MATLKDCFGKLGISGDMADGIRSVIAKYEAEGYAAKDAHRAGVKELARETRKQQAAIAQQIRDAIGPVEQPTEQPAQPQPESQPQPEQAQEQPAQPEQDFVANKFLAEDATGEQGPQPDTTGERSAARPLDTTETKQLEADLAELRKVNPGIADSIAKFAPHEQVQIIEAARQRANLDNERLSALEAQYRDVFGSGAQAGAMRRKAGGMSAGDETQLQRPDFYRERLEDGKNAELASVAMSLGHGDISSGIIPLLQGGIEQFQNRSTIADYAAEQLGEFTKGRQLEFPSSLTKKSIGQDRADMGLPQLPKNQRIKIEPLDQAAKEKLDRNPDAGRELVRELQDKPREPTPAEQVLLANHYSRLKADKNRLSVEYERAHEQGDAEALADIEKVNDRLDEDLQDAQEVIHKEGFASKFARGLAYMQLFHGDDMSIVEMERHKRMAVGGRPLTDTEKAEIRANHKRIGELTAFIDELLKRDRTRSVDEVINNFRKRARYAKEDVPVTPRQQRPEDTQAAVQAFNDQLSSLAERLRTTAYANPFDPQLVKEFVKLAVTAIRAGTLTLRDFTGRVAMSLGDKLAKDHEDYIKQGWAEAVKSETKPEMVGDEFTTQGELSKYAKELTKWYIAQDPKMDRDPLVAAVQKDLQQIRDDITVEDTMDAISDYGQMKELDKSPEAKRYREIRSELQQMRKLLDMEQGQPPKLTGTEKEPTTPEIRRLRRRVHEGMKKLGIKPRGLSAPIDAVRTRLRNQIKDLGQQINRRQRDIKNKTEPNYSADPEIRQMIADRDVMQQWLNELDPKPGRSDAKRIEIATKAVERSIADIERRIKEGDYQPKNSATPKDAALDALKDRRAALRGILNELKAHDPAQQALAEQKATEGFQRRLNEKKAELARRIAEQDFSRQGKGTKHGPYDEATTALQGEVAKLDRQYREMLRLPRALEAVDRQIDTLKQQIRDGELQTRKRNPILNKELEAKLAERDALSKQKRAMLEATPEFKAEQARKLEAAYERSLLDKAARLSERIANKDYSTKPREQFHGPVTEQVAKLQDTLKGIVDQFNNELYNDRFARRTQEKYAQYEKELVTEEYVDPTPRRKQVLTPANQRLAVRTKLMKQARDIKREESQRTAMGKFFGNFLDSYRMLQTTGEFSFMLRQGGKAFRESIGGLLIGDVKPAQRYGTAAARSLHSFFSEQAAKDSDHRIFNDIDLGMADNAGLRLIHEGEHIYGTEELRLHSGLRNLRPFKNFERASRVFFNELRMGTFKANKGIFGDNFSMEQAKSLANFINTCTGYGSLGKLESAAGLMNFMLYSPRNLMASVKYSYGHDYWRASDAQVKKIIARQYARQTIGLAATYMLAGMAGASISIDPRSSDFLKWKFGNTRIDPLEGLSQLFVFVTREVTGETVDSKGVEYNLRPNYHPRNLFVGEDKQIHRNASRGGAAVFFQFARTKAAPLPGMVLNFFDGKSVVGEEFSFVREGGNAIPMTYADLLDAYKEHNVPTDIALTMMAVFGMGLQTYGNKGEAEAQAWLQEQAAKRTNATPAVAR